MIPPHANAEAHARVMAALKSVSAKEICEISVRAGVHNADGSLTEPYGGISPAMFTPEQTAALPILKFFAYEHLPERLHAVSRPFAELAAAMVAVLPAGPELAAGLRKLLEAKDCCVRAALP